MSISVTSGATGQLVIKIQGRFDFSVHKEFKNAYENSASNITSYEIDMGATSYLDSSALGMLLLLRDYAGGDNASIAITRTTPDVRKVLTISNFEQLFKIS